MKSGSIALQFEGFAEGFTDGSDVWEIKDVQVVALYIWRFVETKWAHYSATAVADAGSLPPSQQKEHPTMLAAAPTSQSH